MSPLRRRIWRSIFRWRRAWHGNRSLEKDSSLCNFRHQYIFITLYMCLVERYSAIELHRWLSAAVLRHVVLLGLLYCWLRLLKFFKLSTFLACMIFSSMLGPAMAFDERGSCTLETNFVNVPAVSRDSC